MSPLQPITFQRPRRDPSLVEQAFVSTLAALAQKKFIQDPLLERQGEMLVSEREAEEAFTRERDEAQAGRAITLAERRSGLSREEVEHELGERVRIEEEGLPARRTATTLAMPLAEALGFDAEPLVEGTQLPAFKTRREASSFLDRLESQLEDRTRREATTASLEVQRDAFLQELVGRFAGGPLEPKLIEDEETGEPRFLNQREEDLRKLASVANIGDLVGLSGDARVQALLRLTEAQEPRLLDVPKYSPKLELEWFGRIGKPDDQSIAMVRGLISVLKQVSPDGVQYVGKKGDWFINDQGEAVKVRREEDLFAALPNEARSRVRGALWTQFFPTLEQFELAKVQYPQLQDRIAEETYRKLIQAPAEITPRDQEDEEARLETAARPESFQTQGARVLAIVGGNAAKELAAYTEKFTEDSTAYQTARAKVDSLLSLSDEDLRTELGDLGMVQRAQPGFSPGPGGYSPAIPGGKIPERDALRLHWYQLLDTAWEEAQARRAEARQKQEGEN